VRTVSERDGHPSVGKRRRHIHDADQKRRTGRTSGLGLRENLCSQAMFTGHDRHGGFAGYTLVDERYCLALPGCYDDVHAAPLLCAGLTGYRACAMTGAAKKVLVPGAVLTA